MHWVIHRAHGQRNLGLSLSFVPDFPHFPYSLHRTGRRRYSRRVARTTFQLITDTWRFRTCTNFQTILNFLFICEYLLIFGFLDFEKFFVFVDFSVFIYFSIFLKIERVKSKNELAYTVQGISIVWPDAGRRTVTWSRSPFTVLLASIVWLLSLFRPANASMPASCAIVETLDVDTLNYTSKNSSLIITNV